MASIRHRPWIFALVAGAATGLVILGVGGRIAMRLFAIHNGQSPAWTFGGTMAVIGMGVVSGVAGAVIRAAAAAWLPRRTPASVGTAIFATACLFLTLRGLNPVDTTRLVYFLPLTIVYAVAFEILWRRRASDATESAGPSPAAVSA
jgi:hypothetical protein